MTRSSRDHWPLHALQWSRIGAPLRPTPEDLAICERQVAAWAARTGRPPRALLLGVTPELATMAWPAGTTLVAIDRSEAMIGAVFPAAAGTAIAGDWLAMPAPDRAFDWIVGDGCASTLGYPADYDVFAAELHRVLAPDGELVLRLFAAPEDPESLDEVARALARGEITSFHALKWRIAMCRPPSGQPAKRNVRVVAILRGFEAIAPDRDALAAATGWTRETIDTIDVYRDSDLAYSFPTLAEARARLTRHFTEAACLTAGYELGDRCPTLVLRPRTTRP